MIIFGFTVSAVLIGAGIGLYAADRLKARREINARLASIR